jgi:hypothetical protein
VPCSCELCVQFKAAQNEQRWTSAGSGAKRTKFLYSAKFPFCLCFASPDGTVKVNKPATKASRVRRNVWLEDELFRPSIKDRSEFSPQHPNPFHLTRVGESMRSMKIEQRVYVCSSTRMEERPCPA